MNGVELTRDQDAVYGAIQSLCQVGAPCPKPDDLGAMCGVAGESVYSILHALSNKGLITVERYGQAKRVITDVRTGKSTADFKPAISSPDDISRFVRAGNGSPCWKCGARPDVICEKRSCGNKHGVQFGIAALRALDRAERA